MNNHGKFEFEVRLYKIKTLSHLLIGSGEGGDDPSSVDKPMIKALVYQGAKDEPDRIPYLPASSIHGVVRNRVEDILRERDDLGWEKRKPKGEIDNELEEKIRKDSDLISFVSNLEDGVIFYKNTCYHNEEWDRCEKFKEKKPQSEEEKDERAKKQRWLEDIVERGIPCESCKIFGYTGEQSKVGMTQAYIQKFNRDDESVRYDIITRIAIDPRTRTADAGKLFDMEAVPPGVSFYFFMILSGKIEDEQKKLINQAMKALGMGLDTLGAHYSTGFGYVEVENIFETLSKKSFKGIKVTEKVALIDPAEMDEKIKPPDNKSNNINIEPIDKTKYPKLFTALYNSALNGFFEWNDIMKVKNKFSLSSEVPDSEDNRVKEE